MTENRKQCWVESANDPDTDFPIGNLPFGVFKPAEDPNRDDLSPAMRALNSLNRVCVAIGDQILDLYGCYRAGLLNKLHVPIGWVNGSDQFGILEARAVRQRAAELLTDQELRPKVEQLLVPQRSARMLPPSRIGDYTDFYASIHHAMNVGKLFRPDNPLLPNYKWVPIGYHGRASSIVVSGTEIRRPCGQTKAPDAAEPTFGPSRMLDYELEMGFLVGAGNYLGSTIPVDQARHHIFGLCLVNDWSARDIQSWEYQPLGPFLGKSFGTTISPWVVTLDALEPYRVPVALRPEGDPKPLPYLYSERDQQSGAFDINLEVSLVTARMREANDKPFRISRGNLRDLYWTPAQMLTHHASNGCNLRSGDLLATGTVSGATPDSVGSLLERTRRGADPLQLSNGEQRRFLEDGDEVIFRAWCEREGYPRIGFGQCRGTITPAHPATS
jgi:fumarylacetoacetase